MKILILTTEPLPLPGLPTTGAGLRAWGLLFGLRASGFPDTEIAFAADSVRGTDVDTSVVPGVALFERDELPAFLEERQPDALVLQHWGLARHLPATIPPLAIDLAGPHLLERQLWGSKDPGADRREKLAALRRADFTVCSGDFQRRYFLPFLLEAGFDPRGELAPVIPFSVSPDIPKGTGRDPQRLLHVGYFLPWQDPSAALSTTLDVIEKRGEGTLVIVGGPHPAGDVSGGRYGELVARLKENPHVQMHGVMPFDRLLPLLLGCGAAIDLMPRNAERELAYPTRTVTALWAGLPVLHNDYDELAAPIRKARAGWTLDAADTEKLERTVERILSRPAETESKSQNAQAFVRKNLAWDKTITPLATWCRDPRRRDGATTVPVQAQLERAHTRPSRQRRKTGQAPRASPGTITWSPPETGRPNRLQQALAPLAALMAFTAGIVLLVLFGLVEVARIAAGKNRPGKP